MTKTVVVYHSGYGHTQRVAQFMAEGASAHSETQVVAIDADGNITEAEWAALDAADAIVFGSPTYMGMVSWQFKKFADASSKRWFVRGWKDKVAGGFTISSQPNGDKSSTLQYFITLAMQHAMVWVGQPAMHEPVINRMGASSGLMAQVGATSPAADIPQGDLDTAKGYGERLALVAAKLRG